MQVQTLQKTSSRVREMLVSLLDIGIDLEAAGASIPKCVVPSWGVNPMRLSQVRMKVFPQGEKGSTKIAGELRLVGKMRGRPSRLSAGAPFVVPFVRVLKEDTLSSFDLPNTPGAIGLERFQKGNDGIST